MAACCVLSENLLSESLTATTSLTLSLCTADFIKSVVPFANFENANLSDVLMDRAVLNEANLKNANLQRTVLTRSDLSGARVMRH